MTDFVVAECGIRQLHARIADAVWRKDPVAFGDCYTEDAEWRIAGMTLRGRAEIASTFERLMTNHRCVLMTFRTPILEVGEGTATGRTYVTEQNAFLNGRPGNSIGLYFERFVEQGGRWRVAWRMFQLHYLGRADLSDPFFEHPDYGPPPNMPPLDATVPNYSGLGKN